jgi:tRNA-2-methylthio-N6-dimethylallyladenosine synthase
VGFPGETEKQFEQSVALVEWAKFDNVYLGKYSVRPYTAAASLKDSVSLPEKKRRERVLLKIVRRTAAENHQRNLGQTVRMLVEEKSKDCFYGRTSDNTFVKIISDNIKEDLIGQFVEVRITEARDFGMDGELV